MTHWRKGGRITRLFVLVALVAGTMLIGGAPSDTEAFECGCTYGQWVEIYYYAEPWHATLVGYETCNYCWGEQTPYYVFVNGCPNC